MLNSLPILWILIPISISLIVFRSFALGISKEFKSLSVSSGTKVKRKWGFFPTIPLSIGNNTFEIMSLGLPKLFIITLKHKVNSTFIFDCRPKMHKMKRQKKVMHPSLKKEPLQNLTEGFEEIYEPITNNALIAENFLSEDFQIFLLRFEDEYVRIPAITISKGYLSVILNSKNISASVEKIRTLLEFLDKQVNNAGLKFS